MSGFIGRVSKEPVRDHVLKALRVLQFDDHDSTGLIFGSRHGCKRHRVVGKVDDLIKKMPKTENGKVAIAHTRWSTYTKQEIENVYPIVSQNKYVSLIITGLIDNVLMIRRKLGKRGYVFKSESAIEVVANLIEEFSDGKKIEPLKALKWALGMLEGSYAVVAVFHQEPDRIYYARNETVMMIGQGKDAMMATTDFAAISDEASSYYYPEDKEIGYLTYDKIFAFDDNLKPKITKFKETVIDTESLQLGHYPHYMLKEIEEAPRVIRRLINYYFDGNNYKFDKKIIARINAADNIVFIASGTSHNAALVGQRYLRSFNKKVDVFLASEWIFHAYQSGDNPLYILISQSGETADVLKALKVIRNYGGDVLAITNTEVSTLYKYADFRLLLYAGTEVSVASTKAYIAQITLLSLIYAALVKKITTIAALEKVIESIEDIIARQGQIKDVAQELLTANSVFFLGRGFDYDLASEAQLKLKETTYIHAEAYAGGEFLHGPIALLDENVPVVAFVSDALTFDAMREVVTEVRSRKAPTYVFSTNPFNQTEDSFVIHKPIKAYHSPIVFAVIAQYLAYYIAIGLCRNPDRPRNLAKAVKDRNVE